MRLSFLICTLNWPKGDVSSSNLSSLKPLELFLVLEVVRLLTSAEACVGVEVK